jgi:hypothetical protein
LGEGRVSATDAIEEPTVEGCGILRPQVEVSLGLEGDGDAQEFGLGRDDEMGRD